MMLTDNTKQYWLDKYDALIAEAGKINFTKDS